MHILNARLRGTLTVEASFIMGIILLIIMYQITFTLGLYGKVTDYGEKCAEEIMENGPGIESMRLTRLALRITGKD